MVDGLPEYWVQAVPRALYRPEASARKLRVLDAGKTLTWNCAATPCVPPTARPTRSCRASRPRAKRRQPGGHRGPGARLDANHATAQRDGPPGQLPVDAHTWFRRR